MKKLAIALLVLALLLPGLVSAAPPIIKQLVGPSSAPVASSSEAPGLIPKGFPVIEPLADPNDSAEKETAAQALLHEAYAKYEAGELDAAIDLIFDATKTAPSSVHVLLDSAYFLYEIDHDGAFLEENEALLHDALKIAGGVERVDTLTLLAELLSYDGRELEAIALLSSEMQASVDRQTLSLVLATMQYYANRSEEALATLEEMIEDGPDNMEALRLRAIILTEECRFDEAVIAYKRIAEEWPDSLEGEFGLYLVYKASGQFTKAVRTLDTMLGMGADESLWFDRAQLRLWNLFDPTEALLEAEALLRQDGQSIDAARIKLGALIMLGDYEAAQGVVAPIKQSDPVYAEILRSVLLQGEGDFAQAEQALEALTRSEPESVDAWLNLANVRLHGHCDTEGSLTALGKAFELVGGAGAGPMQLYMLLGDTYRAQGALLEAARAYAYADQLVYDDPSALSELIMVFIEAGRLDGAADTYAQLTRRYPGWMETMKVAFVMMDVLGDEAGGVEAFDAFKAKYPFPAETLTALEGVYRADAGDKDAPAAVREWLDKEPDKRDALDFDYYAYSLVLAGDLSAAREALAKAESLIPAGDTLEAMDSRISIELTRAALLLAEGDQDGCLSALRQAIEYGLPASGLILYDEFEPVAALDAFWELVKLAPETPNDWDLTVLPAIPTP